MKKLLLLCLWVAPLFVISQSRDYLIFGLFGIGWLIDIILDAKWFGQSPNRIGQHILYLKKVWTPKPLQRQYILLIIPNGLTPKGYTRY